MSCSSNLLLPMCIAVRKGSADAIAIRIETSEWVYKDIEHILPTSPLVVMCSDHSIPNGWRVAFEAVDSPRILNSLVSPPIDKYMHVVEVTGSNTVQFNSINGARLKPPVSSGQLVYRKPKDLAQYVDARMDVRDTVGGEILVSFSVYTGELELDPLNNALWLKLGESKTADIPAGEHVFDIELVHTNGTTDRICAANSKFILQDETTTSV